MEQHNYTSTDLLRQQLRSAGYAIKTFLLKDATYFKISSPQGGVWLLQKAHVNYPFTSRAVYDLCKDKPTAQEFVAKQGVMVPETSVYSMQPSDKEIKSLLKKSPLVVKPSDSHASNGVTLNISNDTQLKAAIKDALAVSDEALVQKQVEGDELRFTLVEGKVKAVLLRQTPRLIGDGKSTVKQLLEKENDQRKNLKLKYIRYPLLDKSNIDMAELNLKAILNRGEILHLGRSTMIRSGASVYNVHEQVHPSYIKTAESLAHSTGAGLMVVDMIIQDYTKPQNKNNYVFLEFNTAPALKMFYSCRDGNQYNILDDIQRLFDKALGGDNE